MCKKSSHKLNITISIRVLCIIAIFGLWDHKIFVKRVPGELHWDKLRLRASYGTWWVSGCRFKDYTQCFTYAHFPDIWDARHMPRCTAFLHMTKWPTHDIYWLQWMIYWTIYGTYIALARIYIACVILRKLSSCIGGNCARSFATNKLMDQILPEVFLQTEMI